MKNAHRPRLTEEQIQHLLERYRIRRDTRARDKLVLQYRNLVESIGRRFAGAGEPVEDLVQEGYIGLMSALDGFDASKGVKFSTYATHFVIGQIKHYLRDKGKIIKEPAWLQELNQRMQRVIESLAQQYGRAPTEAEIAQVMKISEEEVSSLLTTRDVFKVGSLDAERDDGSTTGSEIEKVRSRRYLVVLTDLKLPGASGIEVLRAVHQADPTVPVVIMTAYGSIEEAVTAMKEGAFDFIQKPIDLDHLKLLIERAARQQELLRENILLREEYSARYGFPRIVGEHPLMQELDRKSVV